MVTKNRALLSVSDKAGVVELASGLARLGYELLSTGGTARLLREHGLTVVEVSEYTGFPEIMAGRVKTLHPKIAGGLLGRPEFDSKAMQEHDIGAIKVLAVNLYPFAETVARADCTLAEAIENIDVGGPTMLRAAAKNHEHVTVIVDSADHARVLEELERDGQTSATTRLALACKAFEHTSSYDQAISRYLRSQSTATSASDEFGPAFSLELTKRQDMRYGENPHQRAAFYIEAGAPPDSVSAATQLNGKALSFNNVADTDAALECVKSFEAPACVIVKHANPCGVALASTIAGAYEHAFRTDSTSAFGGIIAFNRELDEDTARAIVERQFVEVIIAPGVTAAAAAVVARKENVRLLSCGAWLAAQAAPPGGSPPRDYKRVRGGLLVQDADVAGVAERKLEVVSERAPDPDELDDLQFAFTVAKFVKSNAIVYARDGATVGIGAGQMSRVYSARVGAMKARDEGLAIAGSVLASDAFFPFRDGIDAAAEVGVKAIIQPGGSVRDEEVIAAANEHAMAMVFTGIRHFRH